MRPIRLFVSIAILSGVGFASTVRSFVRSSVSIALRDEWELMALPHRPTMREGERARPSNVRDASTESPAVIPPSLASSKHLYFFLVPAHVSGCQSVANKQKDLALRWQQHLNFALAGGKASSSYSTCCRRPGSHACCLFPDSESTIPGSRRQNERCARTRQDGSIDETRSVNNGGDEDYRASLPE